MNEPSSRLYIEKEIIAKRSSKFLQKQRELFNEIKLTV
jgi:hypothetical protein